MVTVVHATGAMFDEEYTDEDILSLFVLAVAHGSDLKALTRTVREREEYVPEYTP